MRAKRATVCLLMGLALCLSLGATSAQAARSLITKEAIKLKKPEKPSEEQIPGEQIEGACGVAISGTSLYVSDYYHGLIETFIPDPEAPGSPKPFILSSVLSVGTPPEAPCQLATGPGGALYANIWHQSVVRLQPSFQTFDIESSTGVAVDSEGKVYVNDRTHVNVYSSAGALLQEVGLGNLKDAYGLAVFGKELYVPDAGSGTIKVFEPEVDPLNPKRTIDGSKTPQKRFVSLVDASVAVDPTNGNLLVLDNLQPGFEHPEGAVQEFDDEGNFLSQLKEKVIDGGPSGMVVDSATGNLFVTSGNSEGSNVFAWGAYFAGGGGGAVGGEPEGPPSQGAVTSGPQSEAPASATLGETVPARTKAWSSRTAKVRKPKHRRHAHRRVGQRRSAPLRR